MYVAVAVVLALGLCELGLPILNGLAGKQLTTGSLSSLASVVTLAGIAVAVALLAGMYPAFYLSSFWPVQVLKGRVRKGRAGQDWLRNGLVVAQFSISIGLLFGTLVVRSQLYHMQNKKLGFDKAHVLVVHGAHVLGRQAETLRAQFGALPQVVAASLTRSMPGHGFDSMTFKPEQPANYEESSLSYAMVDAHYAEALRLKIVAGRNFSPEDFASDSTAFLLNQSAVEALGWREPIGKRLTRNKYMRGSVVGVVEDFRYGRSKVDPLVIPLLRRLPLFIAVRLHPGNVTEAIAGVREIWKRFVPNQPFEYSFLDEDYGRLYDSEQRMARVFEVFSGLGMFIACLGLFGLAAFTAEQRTKEIGIRKVLGASVPGIVFMLTREFAQWVIAANLIAWPIAYVVMDGWLQDFAYRIEIGWWPFAIAGAAALCVSLLTVSYQAVRAATADPVNALRYE